VASRRGTTLLLMAGESGRLTFILVLVDRVGTGDGLVNDDVSGS
jgi:hypothetical protein